MQKSLPREGTEVTGAEKKLTNMVIVFKNIHLIPRKQSTLSDHKIAFQKSNVLGKDL